MTKSLETIREEVMEMAEKAAFKSHDLTLKPDAVSLSTVEDIADHFLSIIAEEREGLRNEIRLRKNSAIARGDDSASKAFHDVLSLLANSKEV